MITLTPTVSTSSNAWPFVFLAAPLAALCGRMLICGLLWLRVCASPAAEPAAAGSAAVLGISVGATMGYRCSARCMAATRQAIFCSRAKGG